MKIYSYFSDVPELVMFDEIKLSILWRQRWAAAGFEPTILSEWHARQHPDFAVVEAAIAALPTVNPPEYERACFLRWLALGAVGGGIMSDLDVIPYVPWQRMPTPGALMDDHVYLLQERAPSLVYASPRACQRLALMFGIPTIGNRPQDGRPHYSDQYVIEDLSARGEGWIVKNDFVKGFGDMAWETAPFVHYSNGSMAPSGKTPRWKHIPLLRQSTITDQTK